MWNFLGVFGKSHTQKQAIEILTPHFLFLIFIITVAKKQWCCTAVMCDAVVLLCHSVATKEEREQKPCSWTRWSLRRL